MQSNLGQPNLIQPNLINIVQHTKYYFNTIIFGR
jgi:hypothetical protein